MNLNYEEKHQLCYKWTHFFLQKGQQPNYIGRVIINFVSSGKGFVARIYPNLYAPVLEIHTAYLHQFDEDELKATIAHEVSHLIVRINFGTGVKDHGPEFKMVMKLLGYEVKGADKFSKKHIAARKQIHKND